MTGTVSTALEAAEDVREVWTSRHAQRWRPMSWRAVCRLATAER